MFKVLLIGGTGFIGKKLGIKLSHNDIEINLLTRNKSKYTNKLPYPCKIFNWNYQKEEIPQEALEGINAIINLSGDPVDSSKWTNKKKEKIIDSRVNLTKKLVDTMNNNNLQNITFINASAIGYYGDCDDHLLNEDDERNSGFLSDTVKAWEDEALKANENIRTVIIRIGIVLGLEGGMLKRLFPIFKSGFGGTLGCGKQYMSYIHIDDLVNIFYFSLLNQNIKGVYNAVAPNPVTNKEFTKALSKEMKKLSIFKIPSFMLKFMYGEMSQILLFSQRISCKKIIDAGYEFVFENISNALNDIFKRIKDGSGKVQWYYYDEIWINKDIEYVFNFYKEAKNLEKITPKNMKFKILNMSTENIEEGTIINYKLKIKGFNIKWRTLIEKFIENEYFIDVQLNGPYKYWKHTHFFEKIANGILVRDLVKYELPFSFISNKIFAKMVRKDLDKIFNYRKEIVSKEFLK